MIADRERDFQAARIEDLTSQLDHLQETLSGCDWC